MIWQAALDVTERQRVALGQMQAQLMDTIWTLQQKAMRDTPAVRSNLDGCPVAYAQLQHCGNGTTDALVG